MWEQLHTGLFRLVLFFFLSPPSPDYGLPSLSIPRNLVMCLRTHHKHILLKKALVRRKRVEEDPCYLYAEDYRSNSIWGSCFLRNTLVFPSFLSLPADARETAKANITHGKWSVNPKQKKFSFISCFLLSKNK